MGLLLSKLPFKSLVLMRVVLGLHCSPFCSRKSAFSVAASETKKTTDFRIWREESSSPCTVGHWALYTVDKKGNIQPQTKSLHGEEVHVILEHLKKMGFRNAFCKIVLSKERKGNGLRAVCCKVLFKGRRSKDKCCKTVLLKEVVFFFSSFDLEQNLEIT